MSLDKKLLVKLFILFIPVAYASYLFHEFGHWIIGEVLGNNMMYTLNYVWVKDGYYIDASHDLYVSIGGPAFTILFSILFLLVIEKYNTIYLYPFVFFQSFMRFFSLVFGGFSNQDEARISAILGIGTYTIALIVLLILLMLVLRASYKLKINLKQNSYFFTMSTVCQLLVIATYKFFSL
ncbi:MAG: hypothetical protein NTX65_02060 [Ignavibacteriales bacterium]|nr:hypothetical protein [Ignavibacteriales bacterium]